MSNTNYPVGANIPEAPWNKSDQEPVNIDVIISQSLSRSTTIRVTDLTIKFLRLSSVKA